MKVKLVRILFLASALTSVSCKSTSARTESIGTVTINPLFKTPTIWRTINRVGQLRHVLLAIKPTPVTSQTLKDLTIHFDPNAILYCDGKCEAPKQPGESGKQGLGSGVFMESSRASAHGDNWIQFRLNGDGTYIWANKGGSTEDKSPAYGSAEYRLVFEDAENAKLLPAETTADGKFQVTGDYGYRMKWQADGSWLRYDARSPDDKMHQYYLKEVFTADGSETKWTEELFSDNKISGLTEFKIAVPADSALATGDLPDGPERGNLTDADPADAKKQATDADPNRSDAKAGQHDTDPKKSGGNR